MNKSLLLILFFLALLVGLGGAVFMYFKPHQNIAKAKPDYFISANDLFAEYDNDEAAADQKYVAKILQVKGTVNEISAPKEGKQSLVLTAESAMMGGISATFDDAAQIDLSNVKSGQEIEIKCKCKGMLMDVVLTNCSLIK